MVERLGEQPLEVLVSNAGIWETGWTQSRFADVGRRELRDIGAAHALREVCRDSGITVTVPLAGTIATDFTLDDGVDPVLERHGRDRLPLADVVGMIRAVLALSPASCVKEIHMPAMGDRDA